MSHQPSTQAFSRTPGLDCEGLKAPTLIIQKSDILPSSIVRFRPGCDHLTTTADDGHIARIMSAIRLSKTVRIGRDPFTVSGERRPVGRLRFTVDDINSVLQDGQDEILERFRDRLKNRLQLAREQRDQD